jgi:5-methylcytosine-specific restriction endonuclease McrA
MKTCTKCKREFPGTSEYFHRRKDTKDGLRTWCKECSIDVSLNHYRANREARIKAMSLYDKTHPEAQRRSTRKFNALKKGVVHEDWTEKELLSTYGSDCYLCNSPIDLTLPRTGKGSDYALWPDHVIPVSRGGEDTIRNVRPCHRMCNQNKFTKTYDEYIQSLA